MSIQSKNNLKSSSRSLLLVIMFCCSNSLFASLNQVEMSLSLPLKNRQKILLDLGAHSYVELQKIAKNNNKDLNLRWRAITTLGMMYPKSALPLLEKFLSSKKWFLRNASLLALSHGNRSRLKHWLNRSLKDKSLIVRTTAVQIIERLRLREFKSKLWQGLYQRGNFYKKESLWIRKYMARALSKMATSDYLPKFARLINDKDHRLHPYTIRSLETLTQIKFPEEKSFVDKTKRWRKWVKRFQSENSITL